MEPFFWDQSMEQARSTVSQRQREIDLPPDARFVTAAICVRGMVGYSSPTGICTGAVTVSLNDTTEFPRPFVLG